MGTDSYSCNKLLKTNRTPLSIVALDCCSSGKPLVRTKFGALQLPFFSPDPLTFFLIRFTFCLLFILYRVYPFAALFDAHLFSTCPSLYFVRFFLSPNSHSSLYTFLCIFPVMVYTLPTASQSELHDKDLSL